MAQLGKYVLANKELPDRIRRHRLEYPDAEILEQVAEELAKTDFPEEPSLRFVRQVCRWGGYYGVAARIKNANDPEDIVEAFRNAFGLLHKGDEVGALAAINRIVGLGRPAFASKFLRFLAPKSSAILDRIVSEHTGFPLSRLGYGRLIQSCRSVADELEAAGIANPVRHSGEWYVADVEAAFYADMGNFTA